LDPLHVAGHAGALFARDTRLEEQYFEGHKPYNDLVWWYLSALPHLEEWQSGSAMKQSTSIFKKNYIATFV
jgi:hypothetical protein